MNTTFQNNIPHRWCSVSFSFKYQMLPHLVTNMKHLWCLSRMFI